MYITFSLYYTLHLHYKRPMEETVELRENIMTVRHVTDTWLAIYIKYQFIP